MLENIVFLNLKRNDKELYFHKNKYECDFLIKNGLKITNAYQVCFYLNKTNEKWETNGLIEACKSHNLKKGFLLTYDQENDIDIDGIKIHILPVWKWLLNQ